MTISSQNRQAGPYIGNDVATAFTFAFKVFAASDLQVVRTDAAGVESTLTLTTDYTVALNSNQDSNPGGTVTLVAGALVSGTKLTITSSIVPLQATDLTNQGGFYPKVITNALDKLTILIQQALNGLGRSIKLPISDSNYNPTLPGKDNRKGRLLAFNETTGDPTAGPLITSIDTVTANVGAIDTVAASVASVNTVAGSIGNVNAVAGNQANVNTVAGSIGNVNAVGNNIGNVNAVAGNAANINSAVANAANINTVAGSIGNVNAVGNNIGNVNSAAANMTAIVAAPTQATSAANSAAAALSAKTAAEAARDAAVVGAPNVFASTADGLSNGVVNITGLVAGSGGTNGTFDLAFSGGGGANAAGRFVVSGGAVTQVTITNPGTGYTSAPTISFAASSGLTGASATAVTGRRVNTGGYFSVPSSDGNESMILYRADAGPVATEIKRYPSSALLSWSNEYRLTAGSTVATEKVVEPGTNTANSVYQTLTVSAGNVVDVWLTVKAAGRTTVNLYNNGGATMDVRIDLEQGKVYNDNGSWTLDSADISPLGNGWWLVHVVKTVPSSGSGNLQFRLYGPPGTGTPYGTATYSGDGVSGAYVDSLLVYNRTTTTYPFASSKLSAGSWTKLGSTVAAATLANSYTLGGALKLLQDITNEYQLGMGSTYSTNKFAELSGSVSPSCYTSFLWSNGGTYTVAVTARAGERSKLNLFSNGGAVFNVTFDLATEVFSGLGSGQNLTFTRLGNGWYLVALTVLATASANSNLQVRMLDASGNATYTGDGASGLYVDSIRLLASGVSCLQATNPQHPAWTKQGITVASSPAASATGATKLASLVKYIGDMTGDKFVEASGATVSPSVYRSYSFTNGTAYTFGGYFKAGERYRVNLYCNGGALFGATFNLQTGTVESGTGATITSMGGGWYKCEQTVTATSSTSANLQVRTYPASGGHPYGGDGVSGLYANDAYLTAGGANLLSNSSNFGGGSWLLQDVFVTPDVMPYGGLLNLLSTYVDPGQALWSGKKVAVIGTSITAQAQYTVPLAAELGVTLTNLGTSGGSIGQNAHYGSLYIYNAISSIPADSEVVLVEAGTNDFGVSTPTPLGALGDTTTATFHGALYAAVVAIRAQAPSARIVFLTQYSADSRVPAYAIGYTNPNGNTIQQFQKAAVDVAGYCGYPCIDVGRQAGLGYFTGSTYFNDGLHLNATGGQRFAKYVAEQLRVLARAKFLN